MKTVCVLMSTYNGEKYIREQIDSILQQKNVRVTLLIRDDGSQDETVNIIKSYLHDERVSFVKGDNIGYRKSFLWLMDNSPDCDYYAFADQDDVWKKEKLFAAVTLLEHEEKRGPKLYASALTRVDEKLNYLGNQDFPKLKLNYYSEFVRHRFAGCTYVFNNELKKICAGASQIKELRYSHDGFLALMCWLCGGKVVYDKNSYIMFRRHGNNSSVDSLGKLTRIRHELEPFFQKKKYKSDVMKVVERYYLNEVAQEYKQIVIDIAEYDKDWRKYMALISNTQMDCGITMANVLFWLSVLFKCM